MLSLDNKKTAKKLKLKSKLKSGIEKVDISDINLVNLKRLMEHPTIAEMFEPPERNPSSGMDTKPVRTELQQVPVGLVYGEKPGREAE